MATERVRQPRPAAVLPVVVGGVLAAILLVSSWIGSVATLIAVLLVTAASATELSSVGLRRGIRIRLFTAIAGIAVILFAAWGLGESGLAVAMGVLAAALLSSFLLGGMRPGITASLSATLIVAFYLGLFASYLLFAQQLGGVRLIAALLLIVASYHAGRLLMWRIRGPSMMPGLPVSVTWPGAAGGIVAAVLGSLPASVLLPGGLAEGAALGLLAGVAALIGDISGEMLNDQLGVGERETWVPGAGGLSARLTTLLFATPACFYGFKFYFS